jgi:hypothetical protein
MNNSLLMGAILLTLSSAVPAAGSESSMSVLGEQIRLPEGEAAAVGFPKGNTERAHGCAGVPHGATDTICVPAELPDPCAMNPELPGCTLGSSGRNPAKE